MVTLSVGNFKDDDVPEVLYHLVISDGTVLRYPTTYYVDLLVVSVSRFYKRSYLSVRLWVRTHLDRSISITACYMVAVFGRKHGTIKVLAILGTFLRFSGNFIIVGLTYCSCSLVGSLVLYAIYDIFIVISYVVHRRVHCSQGRLLPVPSISVQSIHEWRRHFSM